MNEYVKCNLCGNDAYDIIYPATIAEDEALEAEHLACTNIGHGSHHRIVRCKRCSLMYSNPRDPLTLLSNFYRDVKDEFYSIIIKSREKGFRGSFLQIEKLKKGNRLLDIGCYAGVFMEIARDNGWDICGIEPSGWASRIGRERGLDIRNCAVEDIDKIDDKFDMITMWDIIEHLSDPSGALTLCSQKLNDNGIIAIATMRCEGFFYSLCRKRWPWFMRMHLYYFTFDTLKRMLEKTGFRVILVRPYVHYANLSYLFYKLGIRSSFFLKNRLFQQLMFPVQLGDFMEVYATKQN